MLTPEEKERLEELRIKDALTEEEKQELARLEVKEPEDPAQDEFDDAWDNDNFDSDGGQDGDNNQGGSGEDEEDEDEAGTGQDQTGEEGTDGQSDEDDQDSDSILNSAPDGQSDSQASTDEDDDDDQETPEQKIARLEAEVAKEKQNASTWLGRLQAEQRKHSQTKDKGKGDSDDGASPVDEEDDPELSEFLKEFPDLEKPFTKLITREVNKIVDAKLGKVVDSVGEMQSTLEEDANIKHIAAITEAHPDWEQIRDSGALETWIQHQPKFLQPRLYEICEKGDTEEVIGMFDSYKKAAGKNKSSTNQNSSDSSKSKSESKKKKQQDMEAVPAQSAGPRKPKAKPNKDDFDGGWEYWNEEEEKK